MNVKIVKEHPDGSVDVVLERLSNPDKEFLIHYGFTKMMAEAAEINKWVIEEENQQSSDEVCHFCDGTGESALGVKGCIGCLGTGLKK